MPGHRKSFDDLRQPRHDAGPEGRIVQQRRYKRADRADHIVDERRRADDDNREAVAECHKTDRYGSDICRVLVGGADAGLEQIRAGVAWYFRRYAKELLPDRRQQYADMEAQAKVERRGLWADGEPVPPWEWRAAPKEGNTP